MAVSVADVQAFAPETAGLASGIVSTWLAFAPGAVDPDLFGADADQATLLWVCHQLIRSAGGASGTAGPVTDRKVGDVSVQNAAFEGLLDWAGLKSTAYGQALYQLISRYTAGGAIV